MRSNQFCFFVRDRGILPIDLPCCHGCSVLSYHTPLGDDRLLQVLPAFASKNPVNIACLSLWSVLNDHSGRLRLPPSSSWADGATRIWSGIQRQLPSDCRPPLVPLPRTNRLPFSISMCERRHLVRAANPFIDHRPFGQCPNRHASGTFVRARSRPGCFISLAGVQVLALSLISTV